MLDDSLLQRITMRPEEVGDKPMVRDVHMAVTDVLAMLAAGQSADTILREYPALEREDIRACLLFAQRTIEGEATTALAIAGGDEEEEEPSPHKPDRSRWERLKPALSTIWGWAMLVALWTADRLIDLMLLFQQGKRRIAPTRRRAWPPELIAALMRRQGGRCAYCGRSPSSAGRFEVDHMDPAVDGGPNDPSNLQMLCRECNNRKRDQTDQEFRRRYAALVPRRRWTPPSRTVAQREFKDLMRRTEAASTVRERRRSRMMTARQKITTGSLVCGGIALGAVLLGLDRLGLEGNWAFMPALIVGGAVGGGLWLRARTTGAMDT